MAGGSSSPGAGATSVANRALPPMRPANSPVKAHRGGKGSRGRPGAPPAHAVLGVEVSQDSAALLADILHDLSGSDGDGDDTAGSLGAVTGSHAGGVASGKARARVGVRGGLAVAGAPLGAGEGPTADAVTAVTRVEVVGGARDEVVPLSSAVEPFSVGAGGGGGLMDVQEVDLGGDDTRVMGFGGDASASDVDTGGADDVNAFADDGSGDTGSGDGSDGIEGSDGDDSGGGDGGDGGGDGDEDGPMVSGEGAASYRPPTPPPPMGPALSRLTSDVRVAIHTPELPRRVHPVKPLQSGAGGVPPPAGSVVGTAAHVGDGATLTTAGTPAKEGGALEAAVHDHDGGTTVVGASGDMAAEEGARQAGNVSFESDASVAGMSFLTTPLSVTSSPTRMPPVRVHGDGAHGEVEERQAQRIRDAVDKLSRAELAVSGRCPSRRPSRPQAFVCSCTL